MKGNHTTITIEPFKEIINIVVAKSINKGVKYANKYHEHTPNIDEDDDEERVDGQHLVTEDHHRFIFLRYDSGIHTIVHECFHAVMKVSASRGAKHSDKSEEFYAYILGNLTEDVMNFFYDLKQVKKLNSK